MVRHFVGDPNSTIGAMIKRGLNGDVPSSPPSQSDVAIKTPPPPQQNDPTALNTLERVLDEVEAAMPTDAAAEGVVSQVVPQVVEQTAMAASQAQPVSVSTSKEAAESVSLEQVAQDAARGAQQVELEPQPEIPPEVESYLQKVEDNQQTAPEEIVIADGSQTQPTDHQYPSEPVVVLPITAKEEQLGAKKSPKLSIRWLVEWSRRLMKVFAGRIIYRPIKESTA